MARRFLLRKSLRLKSKKLFRIVIVAIVAKIRLGPITIFEYLEPDEIKIYFESYY